MTEYSFTWESALPHSTQDVFAWHARRGAFERLNPPWRPVSVTSPATSLSDGTTITIKLPIVGPLGLPWTLRHTGVRIGEQFCDEQISGPFRSWRHVHRFLPSGESSSVLRDEISYKPPLAGAAINPFLRAELTRLFRYRHAILASDLRLHARFTGAPRKRILISGSSGFVGSALVAFLETAGHSVRRLVRRTPRDASERQWDPVSGTIDPSAFDEIDAVIHLGGENLFARRWSPQFKALIEESRVRSTRLLCETIASLKRKPEVFICASATGFYGDTGSSVVDERASAGSGFLAETCQAWEDASNQALQGASRLVHLRIGAVLNPRGGALGKMLLPFSLGVGGPLGDGSQYLSWISLQDLLGLFEYALMDATLHGPCNATAPEPVTNKVFTKTLASVLRRPAFLPAPAPVLRLALGEVADALLLSSSRVISSVLRERGYAFEHPTIEDALRFELGRSR